MTKRIIVDYTLASVTCLGRDYTHDLLLRVREVMDSGFEPFGNLTVTGDDETSWLVVQPMVKYVPDA